MTPNEQELQTTIERLEVEVSALTQQFKSFNSARRNFSLSVLRGFGSALGATVVFGLALAVVAQLIQSVDYVPILNGILNSEAIEELVRKFSQPV